MPKHNPILITGAAGEIGGVSRMMVEMLLQQGRASIARRAGPVRSSRLFTSRSRSASAVAISLGSDPRSVWRLASSVASRTRSDCIASAAHSASESLCAAARRRAARSLGRTWARPACVATLLLPPYAPVVPVFVLAFAGRCRRHRVAARASEQAAKDVSGVLSDRSRVDAAAE